MQNINKNVGAAEVQKSRPFTDEEKELHERFVKYGTNAKEWMRKCVMLLPEIDRRGIWRKKGFGSIYEYAAKLSGMSKSTVDDALRILGKLENKPALRAVAEEKGLGAVRPVVTVATPEDERFWAGKAAAMSIHTLETYVREFKKQGGIDMPATINSVLDFRHVTEFEITLKTRQSVNSAVNTGSCKTAAMVRVLMELDPRTAEALLKLKGKGDWNSLMQELLALREEKLQTEEPEPAVNAKRYIPARIRRHVLKRTRGQCAYPGCNKPYKILHHTQRFALEKVHDPRRLVPLCEGHERLAHQGLIEREEGAPQDWHVRKEPNRDRVEYAIDRRVMKYRTPDFSY